MDRKKKRDKQLLIFIRLFLILHIMLGLFWAYVDRFKTVEPFANICGSLIALAYSYRNDENEPEADASHKESYNNRISDFINKLSEDDIKTVLIPFLVPLFFYLFVYENPWYHDIAYRIYHTIMIAIAFPVFILELTAEQVLSFLKYLDSKRR